MNEEKKGKDIYLDRFVPRDFQKEVIRMMENKGYKKVLLNFHRRAGKDVVAFNITIRAALKKVGLYLYCLPTYNQGRKVIWDGLLSNGSSFLSFINPELIKAKNSSDMKIILVNGSIIQIVGSSTASEKLVGTNPQGIVFSEWSRSDPSAYTFLRPAINYNHGWVLFISTPFGHNHMYEMSKIAIANPKEWFYKVLTVDDTKLISKETIDQDVKEGAISEDLVLQEYYGSYDAGAEGAFFANDVNRMILDGRIGYIPFDPSLMVNSAWDIGYNDFTVIIFYQIERTGNVRIINCYHNNLKGMEHYTKLLKDYSNTYGYNYDRHWAPHDIAVHDYGTGQTRIEKAKDLGVTFEISRDKTGKASSILPKLSNQDGIEVTRTIFPKLYIDENKCSRLIKGLENYRREWDTKRNMYKDEPLHDDSSHFAKALQYLAQAVPKNRDGKSSPEELNKRYQESLLGRGNNFPRPFQDINY